MLIDDDPRRMQRVCLAQRFDNHLPGVQLVALIHLLRAKRPGARDIAEEVVRMSGAERRDRQPRLRPGGSVRRVGMHHPAKAGITAIERQMGSGIRGGTPASFHHVALQIDHRHVIDGHGVVGHAAGFDRHQPALPVNRADIAPGEGHQAVARQIHIGLEHLLFQLLHYAASISPARAIRAFTQSRAFATSASGSALLSLHISIRYGPQ